MDWVEVKANTPQMMRAISFNEVFPGANSLVIE